MEGTISARPHDGGQRPRDCRADLADGAAHPCTRLRVSFAADGLGALWTGWMSRYPGEQVQHVRHPRTPMRPRRWPHLEQLRAAAAGENRDVDAAPPWSSPAWRRAQRRPCGQRAWPTRRVLPRSPAMSAFRPAQTGSGSRDVARDAASRSTTWHVSLRRRRGGVRDLVRAFGTDGSTAPQDGLEQVRPRSPTGSRGCTASRSHAFRAGSRRWSHRSCALFVAPPRQRRARRPAPRPGPAPGHALVRHDFEEPLAPPRPGSASGP